MANTHVENKELSKTYELFNKLNNYINPNNDYEAETKLLAKFLNSEEDGDFNETSNNKLFRNDAGNADSFDINKTFVNLIKQAIKCKIHNINPDVVDIAKDTKGLFKFIRARDDKAEGTAILDHEKVKNILASLDVINTIIDVYDAYAHFIKNNPGVYAIEDFKNIVIVKEDDKKEGNSASDSKNSGYYINSQISSSDSSFTDGLDTTNNKPINQDILFLSIKSFDTKFLEDYIKKHNFTETNFDNKEHIGNEAQANDSDIAPEKAGDPLFNAAGTLNTGSSKIFIKGIYLKKNVSDDDYKIVTDKADDSRTALENADYNNIDVSTYKIRNQVIFKEFINYMCKLKNKDKYNGVYAVLNLLRMFKVYIQLMITNCNIMFNRVFLINDTGSDLTYARKTTYHGTPESSDHQGFVFKSITNENIKKICYTATNGIYASDHSTTNKGTKQYFSDINGISLIDGSTSATVTIGNVELYTSGSTLDAGKSEMLNNSYYGEALRENKKFQDNIITTLNKLKYELSESISILYKDIDITSENNSGFEAKVIDRNTIRIKRRNELLKDIFDKNVGIFNDNNIGSEDNSVDTDGVIDDNKSFGLKTILSELKDRDMEEAFINDNVKIISRYYHIKIDNKPYEIVKINKTSSGYLEFDIRARLVYSDYEDYYNIDQVNAPILDPPSSNSTFFISDIAANGDKSYTVDGGAKFDDYNIAQSKGHLLFHNNSDSENIVKLSKKDAYDYNNTYISNIRSIKDLNSSINTNESKIKNYETIYNTYKSRYDFMYNQFIAYSTIIAILAVALLVGSVSSNNLATTKLITLICFGIIILIFVTYYVFNILYMNEHFTNKKKVEKFEVGTYRLIDMAPFPVVEGPHDNKHLEFSTTDQSKNFMYKKANFVQNQFDSINDRIIKNFELLNVGIRQNDSNYAFSNLMNISTNERISTNKINSILDNKKVNTTTHIDLLKYEIAVYRVKINTLLYSALVIIGLITINLYTEGEYYGNLVFIGTLFGIIILTYYLTYSNHIVRTESKNFYWGKEFEASFE